MKEFLKAIIYTGIFAVPFITLIVANNLFFPFITGKNFSFRIIVEIIFAAWIILAVLDPVYRPRWSWILGSFGIFLVVMFFANLFGVHPATSFWSNFERMEGYVALVHIFLFFIVAGTMMRTQQHWNWFWHTSIAVAFIVAVHGLGQMAGVIDGGGSRISGRLGNAAYMAIYMLFHIFLLFYLFVRSNNLYARFAYVGLLLLFTFVLLQTGTRGTAIGLVVGTGVMAAYIAIFASRFPQFRNYAIGACALFVILIGSFLAVRDAAFVQDNRVLSRIANINLQEDLQVRGTIWNLAWIGVQERPILGWGQGNFNYVFNEQYDPFLYDQEQWFDRVHNIFLDWLIAGGILGFIAYFSILGAAVFHIVRLTARNPEEPGFTVLEQGVLLGLLAAYLTHNAVVFDNIVSYIFFGAILAMIHARISTPIKKIATTKVPRAMVEQVVAPAVLVIALATIYYVNVPSLLAAGDIINALRSQTVNAQIENFQLALDRGGMGRQEIVEQMAQQALAAAQSTDVPEADRLRYLEAVQVALDDLVAYKPGDARIHVFFGSFYRGANNPSASQEQFAIARELSPRKPTIIIQQGAAELSLGNQEAAKEFFAEAFRLDERNDQARLLYVAMLLQTGSSTEALALIDEVRDVREVSVDTFQLFSDRQAAALRMAMTGSEEAGDDQDSVQVSNSFKEQLAADNFVINSVNMAEEFDLLAELFEIRVARNAESAQDWATLAFAYFQAGQNDTALEVLTEGSRAVPSFAPTAACYAANIEENRDPQIGC